MANANDSVNALPTINLLPYHAERRADKRKKVFMSLGAAALAGAGAVTSTRERGSTCERASARPSPMAVPRRP